MSIQFGHLSGLPCIGGPLNRKRLELQCPQSGTLRFSMRGETGRYVHDIEVSGYPKDKYECLRWEKS